MAAGVDPVLTAVLTGSAAILGGVSTGLVTGYVTGRVERLKLRTGIRDRTHERLLDAVLGVTSASRRYLLWLDATNRDLPTMSDEGFDKAFEQANRRADEFITAASKVQLLCPDSLLPLWTAYGKQVDILVTTLTQAMQARTGSTDATRAAIQDLNRTFDDFVEAFRAELDRIRQHLV